MSRFRFLRSFQRSFRLERNVYDNRYAQSIDLSQIESYWGNEASKLSWFKNFDAVYDGENIKFPTYFKGGELNLCYNAVDRHLENLSDHNAIIYESQPLGISEKISFAQLHEKVCKMALKMQQLGVSKGDRVLIYMPMIPDAVVSMLAAARLGAPHVVVFGGFAPKELAARIKDSSPKLIITASHGFEPTRAICYESFVSEALQLLEYEPENFIVKDRTKSVVQDGSSESILSKRFSSKIHSMDEILQGTIAPDTYPSCVPVESSHDLYVLHTSGTTGKPKGVVRDTGGHATALMHCMQHFMQCHFQDKDEIYFAASDIGWVVGHSFSVYGPLLNGNTTVIYEGKPIPLNYTAAKSESNNKKYLWDVILRNRVTRLYLAPTTLRAIRAQDPTLESFNPEIRNFLKSIFVVGERCDPDTIEFFSNQLQIPLVDNYWQTETGSPIIGFQDTNVGTVYGSCGKPVPGFNVEIMPTGDLCVKLPLPPGCLKTIHNDKERYINDYLSRYDGYYLTGDVAEKDENGYISVMARTTDIINTAGHRLSTGLLEQVISSHKDIIECAVVGQKDDIKGYMPFAFVVARHPSDTLLAEIQESIRHDVGPIALLKNLVVVPSLPKTRSGKTLRGTLQSILNKEDFNVPATIEDMQVLEDIKSIILAKKY